MNEDSHFWSWLAGFIDGEGSIGIRRNAYKKQRFSYKPYFSLAQKNRNVIDFIQSKIGGLIAVDKGKPNCFYHHFFIYNRDKLQDILPKLIPFLKIKNKQAELMLEYYNNCPHNDAKCYKLRGEYFKQFMLLNTHGNGDKGGRYLEFERKLKSKEIRS